MWKAWPTIPNYAKWRVLEFEDTNRVRSNAGCALTMFVEPELLPTRTSAVRSKMESSDQGRAVKSLRHNCRLRITYLNCSRCIHVRGDCDPIRQISRSVKSVARANRSG